MSLRPSFSAFRLDRFRILLSKGDPSLETALRDRLAETVDDEDELEHEQTMANLVLRGELRLERETEAVQNLVVCLAQVQQELLNSESLFWETFLAQVADGEETIPSAPWLLLQYLIAGRPLIGTTIETNWTFYAYFTCAESKEIFHFIRSHPRFQQEYGFSEAVEWMDLVEREGLDVFYFAS
jgi:hypothetical protein